MKFYLAPMEGLTGYVYRNAYHAYFGNIDKYFIPFIAANQHGKLSTRELHDMLPKHNEGMIAVPQILTNNADDYIRVARQLKDYGYEEINLNLGCPSGTVVAKNKGSGFLSQPEALEQFLDQIFEADITKISIKTRLGKESTEEWERLRLLFEKYPMEELIIHPRIQKDFYKNKPRMEAFNEAVVESQHSLCYNGDIFTTEDYTAFREAFPQVEKVMLGRGIIGNPGLVGEIQTGDMLDKQVLQAFHQKLYVDYQGILSGERNVLFKMKETWFYMIQIFSNWEKYGKKIKKVQNLKEYEALIAKLFEEEHIVSGVGVFSNKKSGI